MDKSLKIQKGTLFIFQFSFLKFYFYVSFERKGVYFHLFFFFFFLQIPAFTDLGC